MPDERAVEVGQLSQPVQTDSSQATVGYFEPHQLADLSKSGRLYLVADDVSGTAAGQVASRYAVQKILHSFYTTDTPDPEGRLLAVIRQANADIFERNKQYPERRPMATSLVAALIHGHKLFVANVGDSRVYVVWDQDIERLTPDTAPVASPQAEEGPTPRTTPPERLISDKTESPPESSARTPHQRVPQGLGLDKTVNVDTFSRRLFAGDIVVLCSGGLTGYVTEAEIAQTITRHPPEQAIRRLINLAGQRGQRDHIAISVTRILSSPAATRPPAPMTLPSAPKWSDLETPTKPGRPPPAKPTLPSPTQTAPMPGVKPRPTRPLDTGQEWRRKRWPIWALILLLLLCLCLTPWLTWRYLISPEMIASVPFLSEVEPIIRDGAEALGLDLAEAEIESTATAQSEPVTPSPTADTPAPPTGTLVAENNSPLPTPETTFVSPVSTPTGAPDQAVSPTAVPPSVEPTPPTPSPTPAPTIVLPPDCVSKARFGRDVTVPDGTKFAPAEAFEKVWLLQNAGDCPWGPGYTVRFIDGDLMGTNSQAPILEVVPPDTNGEISVPMIAPAIPGQYRGEWQLYDLTGEPFGPEIYLEIEVVPPDPSQIDQSSLTTLYDFIEKAGEATWSSDEVAYRLAETDISETLKLPAPRGLVVRGGAQLRGNVASEGKVLLTYPHQELGFIEGTYPVDIPLQPTDALAATVGFIKLSILSDDGVTFEVIFEPADGSEQVILSRTVLYKDSPVTELQPLVGIEPGQTGTFTLRVLGGQSLSQDWAVWIDLRLIRP